MHRTAQLCRHLQACDKGAAAGMAAGEPPAWHAIGPPSQLGARDHHAPIPIDTIAITTTTTATASLHPSRAHTTPKEASRPSLPRLDDGHLGDGPLASIRAAGPHRRRHRRACAPSALCHPIWCGPGCLQHRRRRRSRAFALPVRHCSSPHPCSPPPPVSANNVTRSPQ